MKENKKVYTHIEEDLYKWPIYQISKNRSSFVDRLVNHTYRKLAYKYDNDFEDLLEKTIYQERIRIKRKPWRVDPPNEEAFWNRLKTRLGKAKRYKSENKLKEFERKSIYRIIQRYAEEIVGSFEPKTYLFARKFLTALFNILLGENLLKWFWKLWHRKDHLHHALKVYGDIDQVRNLAQRGTIILLPTHFSNLDSILIGTYLTQRWGFRLFHMELA